MGPPETSVSMKRSALGLLVLGVVVALAGLTFTLQGLGYVGPVGGLMYNNPVWVTQGELTFVIGAVIAIAAFALSRQGSSPKP